LCFTLFKLHVTIPDEYRQRYDFKEPFDAVESSIRLWATNLALSFLKDCDERNEDYYFNLYTKLLSLTGQRELEELYRNFLKCSKLIYLETVISGLASHTILKSFKDADQQKNGLEACLA
jgi:hypothetical protein